MTSDPDETLTPLGCANVYQDGDAFGFPISIGNSEVATIWRMGTDWFLAVLSNGNRLGHFRTFPDALADIGVRCFHDEFEVSVH